MGVFSSVKTVPLTRGGTYLEEGRYRVQIDSCKMIRGRGGDAFVCEFSVLESSNPKSHPVGSKASWYCGLTKVPEAALRDIVLFAAALFGIDTDDKEKIREEITEEVLEWLVMDSNPIGKQEVRMTVGVKKKPTKDGRGVFSVHTWETAENPPNA